MSTSVQEEEVLVDFEEEEEEERQNEIFDKNDDPRAPKRKGESFRKVGNRKGKGTNTESFDPMSTVVGSSLSLCVRDRSIRTRR